MRAGERRAAMNPREKEMSLTATCFRAIRRHFSAVGPGAVSDLPIHIIKDLLPHLSVCQLDELQPTLNQKGISTKDAWIGILLQISELKDFPTEEEAKHEVMRSLFTPVFYGFTTGYIKRNFSDLNTPSFLWAAAKSIKHFSLLNVNKHLQSLTAEQRPLLDLLETHISSIGISQYIDISKRKSLTPLYVLHRLLDHGSATKLVVLAHFPIMLAWLLHGRGSQYAHPELKDLFSSKHVSPQAASPITGRASCSPAHEAQAPEDQDDEVTSCKKRKLDFAFVEGNEPGKENSTVDPQVLCNIFTPCGRPSAACPWGQIQSLEIRECRSESLAVLNASLPTFFCLRSLSLHSFGTFFDADVYSLARALRQLSQSSCSRLTDLSISVLSCSKLLEKLLEANPKVTSLNVEIQSFLFNIDWNAESQADRELPLEKLTVKVGELHTDLPLFTSVLRRSPRLTSLHISGMRLQLGFSQSQLLTTLSELKHLRSLSLDDMKLSDCLPNILNLLRNCKLEELVLNDCRLLEMCRDKEESLQQLVAALKEVPSLHTLSLAQNRLAKNVCVLAELFSGSLPSSVRRLNISSNFIQPSEMLKFAQRLRTHRPRHRLTLDLRKNPGDRDPKTWSTALETLRPFCLLLVEGWSSTDMMVDYISNM